MRKITKELIMKTLRIEDSEWGYRLAVFFDGDGNKISRAVPWTFFNASKEEVAGYFYENFYR